MANSIHCNDSLSFSFNCSLVNGILTYVAIEEVFGASTFELLDIVIMFKQGYLHLDKYNLCILVLDILRPKMVLNPIQDLNL